jgi:Domain of unknown function (DUF5753)
MASPLPVSASGLAAVRAGWPGPLSQTMMRSSPPTDVLRRWCELCHVDFELYEASARLAWVAADSPVPVWFESFFRAQVLAHTIRTWHPIIVPGPLQTPGYARALHEAWQTFVNGIK